MATEEPATTSRWRSTGTFIILAILILLAVGAVLHFQRPAQTGAVQPGVLKVGDQRGGIQALLRAAGELDHVPYQIEWALFPAASPLLEALGAGAIDIGGIGGAPYAFAYASGAKIKAVYAYRPQNASIGHASAIIVGKGSTIRTLADLKGKKLATIRGSAGQDLALKLLEHAGLKASDVQWVYLNNGESKAALGSGSIDAWSTWGSYVGIAVLEDGDRVLADGTGVTSGVGFYAATDTAIQTKRAILADFVQRVTRARHWALSHPREYARILAKETGLPFNVAFFSISSYLGSSVLIDDALVAEQGRSSNAIIARASFPLFPTRGALMIPRSTMR